MARAFSESRRGDQPVSIRPGPYHPSMTLAEPQLVDAAPPSTPRRFCRSCMHDVSGLLMVRCTECGQEFNPGDTSTTLDAPIPPWRRSPILKHGVRVAAVLFIIVGFKFTVFPRPADWDDWRLWLWEPV